MQKIARVKKVDVCKHAQVHIQLQDKSFKQDQMLILGFEACIIKIQAF